MRAVQWTAELWAEFIDGSMSMATLVVGPANVWAEAAHLGVKSLLLWWRKLGVKSSGGIAALFDLRIALGAVLLHQVKSFGCGELVEFGMRHRHALGLRRFHGCGIGVPGAFLLWRDLQQGFQIGHMPLVAFGHALLHFDRVFVHVAMTFASSEPR